MFAEGLSANIYKLVSKEKSENNWCHKLWTAVFSIDAPFQICKLLIS